MSLRSTDRVTFMLIAGAAMSPPANIEIWSGAHQPAGIVDLYSLQPLLSASQIDGGLVRQGDGAGVEDIL